MARNSRRVRAALERCADALDFAAGQAEAGAWRWVAIAACIGLQGALVAALSGYDTAQPDAVRHPDSGDGPARVATLQTLLRRAASPDHLGDPERLGGLTGPKRQALELVELRNQAVHVDLGDNPLDLSRVPALLEGVARLVRHLVLDHPAFAAEADGGFPQRIDRALARLSATIC
ncbi:MAG: hypothetical protein AAFX86_14585 [Pseudomonadota bacterium]